MQDVSSALRMLVFVAFKEYLTLVDYLTMKWMLRILPYQNNCNQKFSVNLKFRESR